MSKIPWGKTTEPVLSSADLEKPLLDWVNPLPFWLREAVLDGRLNVVEVKGVQLLQGKATNPQGTVIQFL